MPYKAWQARLKYILKQILPPVVADTAKSIQIFFQRGSAATGPPALEVVPDDNHAWSAYQGWSHQSIVETQRRKWPLFLASVEGNRPLGWPHEALLSISGVPIDIGTHNNIICSAMCWGASRSKQSALSVFLIGGRHRTLLHLRTTTLSRIGSRVCRQRLRRPLRRRPRTVTRSELSVGRCRGTSQALRPRVRQFVLAVHS